MRVNLILIILLLGCGACLASSEVSPQAAKNLVEFKKYLDDGILPRVADYLKENQEEYSSLRCALDILHWASSLDKLWAWNMLDANGKFPSGLLYGNFYSLGQYDECLSITTEKTGKNFKGKYCPIYMDLNNLTLTVSSLLPNVSVDGLPNIALTFTMGICLPDSCNTEQFRNLIDRNLEFSNITISNKILSFEDRMCSTTDSSIYSGADIAAIVIYCLFAAGIVFSTVYDLFGNFVYNVKKKNQSYNALISFSLYTNTKKLLKINKSSGTLRCLNGIRTISVMWVILCHRFNITNGSPMFNTISKLDLIKNTGFYFIFGGAMSVDTFFTISGMLLAYVFFNQQQKAPHFNLGLFYFHRFMRLWPAMAALVLLRATVFFYFGDGPLWPMEVYSREVCAVSWWSTLLYVQNYVHPLQMCGNHLWYLAIDTQLYFLSPILLYPLLKSPKWGVYNMIFWILAAQVTCITIVYMHNWSGVLALDFDYWIKFYFASHMRANVWLIGFGLGYLLFRIKNKKIEINKYLVYILWLISLAIMFAVVLGIKPMLQLDHEITHLQDSTYSAFAKTAWSLAISWIIFACVTGHGGPVNWFLSLRIFELIGRISYSLYLIHLSVQILFNASSRVVRHFSGFEMIYQYFGDVIFTILISYIWVMAFESPFLNIERLLLAKAKPATTPKVEKNKEENIESQDISKQKV